MSSEVIGSWFSYTSFLILGFKFEVSMCPPNNMLKLPISSVLNILWGPVFRTPPKPTPKTTCKRIVFEPEWIVIGWRFRVDFSQFESCCFWCGFGSGFGKPCESWTCCNPLRPDPITRKRKSSCNWAKDIPKDTTNRWKRRKDLTWNNAFLHILPTGDDGSWSNNVSLPCRR